MPLPKIELPIYDLKLVSVPEPIKYRPFLVKEEKLLLLALQSNDESSIYNAIKQVVNNCILGDLDIEKIPIFDLEYLFLQLRAQSIGNVVESYYACKNRVVNGEEESMCDHMMPISIDLLDVEPPIKDLPTRIALTNTMGVQMKFPTVKSMRSVKDVIESNDSDALYHLIYDCLDYAYDAEEIYYARETTYEEFKSFLETLTQPQFDRITIFFENMPNISYTTNHTCEKCGFVHKITMEGLVDFFI
jgi:hypothetical protein